MNTTGQTEIRAMRPEEKKAVVAIMRRAFGPIQQLFFSLKGQVLVAADGDHLLGGTVLDTFSLPGGRKGGIILWIFTDPAVHGRGAGQALAEGAIGYFEEQGCTDLFACVEGYNTSSSKLFSTRGFGILSPGEQIRRFGPAVVKMWYHTFHFVDVGHFLWSKPAPERPDNPNLQWWGSLLMNSILVWLALWSQHGFRSFNPAYVFIVPLILLLFFGGRSLAMLAAARAQGLTLRYRAWESGFPLGAAIALAFGGFYPNPGSYYPTTDNWRYREWLGRLGPVALAGVLPALLITWTAWAAGSFIPLTEEIGLWRDLTLMIGVLLNLLDVVTAFFPLSSFNGRRLWDWKPWLWGIFALATILSIIVIVR